MTLVDRLSARRQDLIATIQRLGPVPSHIAMLAAVDTVLRLLEAPPADALPGERAVVSDDGGSIVLVVYAGAGQVAAVEIAPHRALGLAAELLAAAHRHIARVPVGSPSPYQAAGCAGSAVVT